MPKFYCIHCGQHIDATDDMAGSKAACPTCRGEIAVPLTVAARKELTLRQTAFSGSDRQPKGSFGKITSLLGAGALFLGMIIIGRSCGAITGQRMAEKHNESRAAIDAAKRSKEQPFTSGFHGDSFTSFVTIEKAGLTMQIPGELNSLTEERDSGGEVTLLEKYTSVSTTRSFILKHFVFKSPRTVAPSEAADMTERDLRSQPGYNATRLSIGVSDMDGLILDLNYKGMGQSVEQTILYFSKGEELWEIHLFGVNDTDLDSLRVMKAKVFSSITIKR